MFSEFLFLSLFLASGCSQSTQTLQKNPSNFWAWLSIVYHFLHQTNLVGSGVWGATLNIIPSGTMQDGCCGEQTNT
jgi:hypothetical protein